ncbi:hypothetical protein EBBID32_8860 [Sphingobium indicum BiD32]|uniref:Uncharacterized protein n=1 Tax=Sphingobium indicum BiD32 TaxID=1301087 RepID=N1MH41_9SPHN|nr:hypothetical protein [Sphingobium indicum]CCW16550.1 hypothetical protein EBBID32_8860 [Sphingobium indicum BiD32]
MRSKHPHSDQFPFDWSTDAELERMIEARVAIRAEAAALRWRFRLILIESTLMAGLVLAAGFALHQPSALVLRGAATVGVACLVSGLLLIGLSGLSGHLAARYRHWRNQ